jgi:uncharacterized protein YdaU (DUF1376 family)
MVEANSVNYYRRFMADYGSKTASLSLAEHGAYNLLLDTCYSTERGLPAAYDALYRLCRAMTKPEQDAVKSVADAFFPIGQDGLRHNPRADDEIAKAKATIAKQRESGVESAAKRWSTNGSTHKSTDTEAIQPPTSNLQPPNTNNQPPTSTRGQNPSAARRASARVNGKAKIEPPTNPCWDGYSGAYTLRYGVAPTRNAKVNAMLARLLERIPVAEAPDIAAFYVRSNRGLYVSAKHCVDLLLRDAEGLRTEWATGRTITDTEARQADRTAATGNAFSGLIAEARARELTEKTRAE